MEAEMQFPGVVKLQLDTRKSELCHLVFRLNGTHLLIIYKLFNLTLRYLVSLPVAKLRLELRGGCFFFQLLQPFLFLFFPFNFVGEASGATPLVTSMLFYLQIECRRQGCWCYLEKYYSVAMSKAPGTYIT